MKLIFLDVDGVLNSFRNVMAYRGYPHPHDTMWQLDSLAINMVKRLCEETNASIVISSTWRLTFSKAETWTERFDSLFHWLNAPVIGVTPHGYWDNTHDQNSYFRGGEVNVFIGRWNDTHPDDIVTKYVIIDDDKDFFPGQPLVQTDGMEGFLFKDFLEALYILDPHNKIVLQWKGKEEKRDLT